jgi:hypothetical protein
MKSVEQLTTKKNIKKVLCLRELRGEKNYQEESSE